MDASNKITMGFSLSNVRIYWVTTAHKQVLDLKADYNLVVLLSIGRGIQNNKSTTKST